MQQVKIKKQNKNAKVPTYATEAAAGADLYACLNAPVTISSGETAFIGTGIAAEIPAGFAGLVFARSGLASKKGLAPANKVGVVDSDYRGEIIVALHNHSSLAVCVADGERIAQLVIVPYLRASFLLADDLEDTKRGSGGFGSTGKM